MKLGVIVESFRLPFREGVEMARSIGADGIQAYATVGYLNPDELFYLRSRGIPEPEARRLQMIAFLSPVLSRLPEALIEEIHAGLS